MENAENAGMSETPDLQAEKAAKFNQILLLIVSRYKDYIEEKEEISVAELPRFVMPTAQLVAKKANEIKEGISNFSYDSNFKEASMSAFNFVKDNIEEIILPLQFWLNPEDLLKFTGGDITDKNILLCSLLIALGNPSSKVIVVTNDADRNIKVYYEFNNAITMMDVISGDIKEFPSREEMLKSFNITENVTAYEFNDQMYVDIE